MWEGMSLVPASKCGDFPQRLKLHSPNSSQSLSCPFPIGTTCPHYSNMKNMENSSDWKEKPVVAMSLGPFKIMLFRYFPSDVTPSTYRHYRARLSSVLKENCMRGYFKF
jgi:hypothetical protein